MFYAQTIGGIRIHANNYYSDQPVICPGCGARVYLKKGNKNLAHFAHYPHSDCQQFSEGESQLHLHGKLILYNWAKSQNIQVEMEAWLPELKQRPDLLLEINRRRIVLEYQCSPISFNKLKERTQGYRDYGYEVYWICGMAYYPKERLTDNIRMFLQKNGSLICLDSIHGIIYHFQDFQFNKHNKLTWVRRTNNLSILYLNEFEDLFQRLIQRRILDKTTMTYPKQVALLSKKDKVHKDFLNDLYINQNALASLPTFLFSLPNKNLVYQTPAYIWKYTFLKHLTDRLSKEDIDAFIKTIPRYEMLFYEEEPVLDFIQELEDKQILIRTGEKDWQVSSFSLLNK